MHNPRQRLHYIVTKSQILQGRDYEVKIQVPDDGSTHTSQSLQWRFLAPLIKYFLPINRNFRGKTHKNLFIKNCFLPEPMCMVPNTDCVNCIT